jgi:hypothetical protein
MTNNPAPGYYPDSSGQPRWWDGQQWAQHQPSQRPVAPAIAPAPPVRPYVVPPQQVAFAVPVSNGYATAALVCGIAGFVLMGIPFFIGWFVGGIPDILAVIFGIVGLSRSGALYGVGRAPAIVGLVLGGVSLLSVFVGAGSLW